MTSREQEGRLVVFTTLAPDARTAQDWAYSAWTHTKSENVQSLLATMGKGHDSGALN